MDASSSSSSSANPSSSKRKAISAVSVPCAPETNCEPPTASSSKKPKSEPPSLSCVPEDVLTQIFVRIAGTDWRGNIQSVAAVSKQFMRLCEQPIVLQSLASSQVTMMWVDGKRLFKRCLGIGHPHAQLLMGIFDYFDNQRGDERREIGFMNLRLSANQGHREAMYVFGMVLFCLGGPARQKGLDMLNSLMHPSCLHESMRICRDLRNATVSRWESVFRFSRQMDDLLMRLDYDRCHCNGKTAKFVDLCWSDRRDRILEGDVVPSSEVCLNCFWEDDCRRFFYLQRGRMFFNYYNRY